MSETGQNYFNYFTEIEERFQRQRGAQVFLSPVDWALIEAWKQSGIPLAAALSGIEQAFAKFSSGRRRDSARPRSLLYCAPAVMQAAETMQAAAVGGHTPETEADHRAGEEFAPPRLAAACDSWRRRIEAAKLPQGLESTQAEVADALAGWVRQLAAEPPPAGTGMPFNLEEMERYFSALEDKLAAGCQQHAPVEALAAIRAELDRALVPYRRRLNAAQLAALEPQFLRQRLLEFYRLPRLSLFHLT